MKKIVLILLAVAWVATFPSGAQEVNYDESKVGPYVLENPLVFANGKKVRSKADWELRRSEILDIFQNEMYGRMPGKPEALVLETIEEGKTMAGTALRRQVRMWFKADKSGPSVDWLIITPARAKGPVPTVILLNYEGNHTVLPDPEIIVPDAWMRAKYGFKADPNARGILSDPSSITRLPADLLVARPAGGIRLHSPVLSLGGQGSFKDRQYHGPCGMGLGPDEGNGHDRKGPCP